ncbi:MAG: hypothetical protein HQL13_05025 [Candidatus Omnitrophica bacterium]|nr:hypothetical protein [Candidatus Omnitrophota bacterium]
MKRFILIALFILSFNTALFADSNEQVITLKDGSQIKGHLEGVKDGVYTVKTPIIGDVHVAAHDVASITNGSQPNSSKAPNNSNNQAPVSTDNSSANSSGNSSGFENQVAAAQQRLTSNPESMAVIQEMAQDPEIMQALQDPELIQAVTNHDISAVQNNPRLQELLKNPKMQAFLQKIMAQQISQSSNSSSK